MCHECFAVFRERIISFEEYIQSPFTKIKLALHVPYSWYRLLHLECHFFNLESQLII